MGFLSYMGDFAAALYSTPGNFFQNPAWLQALYALIALIILYLIRPRPKKKVIPSLMFLMKMTGKRSKNSLFHHLMRTLFLLLQFLAILFLCLALAEPFRLTEEGAKDKSVILIVDGSASSQAMIGSTTRFAFSIDAAKKNLALKNTIILAAKRPNLVLEDGDYDNGVSVLATLRPKDTGSNLADALIYAGEIAEISGARIILISDMINTDRDTDIFAIKKTLEAKQIDVEFQNVFSNIRNVGVVDMEIDEDETTLFIKNFNKFKVPLDVIIDDTKESIEIEPESIKPFGFVTLPMTTKVTLDVNDEFPVDNVIYTSTPDSTKIEILLITNNKKTTNLERALLASPHVSITKAAPPVVPDKGYDVIIIKDVLTDKFLPADIATIINNVKDGKTAIVCIQDGLLAMDLKELMPMSFYGRKNETQIMTAENKYTEVAEGTYINFGEVSPYDVARPYVNDVVALATDTNESDLVSLVKLGDGYVVYYGILEENSDFWQSPDYPLFWNNLIEILVDKKDAITNMNKKTGDILTLEDEEIIVTPSGKKLKTKSLLLEEKGIYHVGNTSVAVNLLDEKESDVSLEIKDTSESYFEEGAFEKIKVKKDLSMLFIAIGLIFLFFEFIYLKIRGDI
ncbi:hypothetical protein COV93_02545 [Candidatus Woesearchaeota archaeon CG11_big_fil_rev_8_21_14_0_20_43_8]|nr:MAG: hypothetical protein COV93_02545 [Candidatus Woesearchaeota archaeon CG11_big_fil_rev_8_21_14_0_20_43_8]